MNAWNGCIATIEAGIEAKRTLGALHPKLKHRPAVASAR
jgi:hypothetical protein